MCKRAAWNRQYMSHINNTHNLHTIKRQLGGLQVRIYTVPGGVSQQGVCPSRGRVPEGRVPAGGVPGWGVSQQGACPEGRVPAGGTGRNTEAGFPRRPGMFPTKPSPRNACAFTSGRKSTSINFKRQSNTLKVVFLGRISPGGRAGRLLSRRLLVRFPECRGVRPERDVCPLRCVHQSVNVGAVL